MTQMDIFNNLEKEITAVILTANGKSSLTYFTMDGEVIKAGWIQKSSIPSIAYKLINLGYKNLYRSAMAN